HPLRRPSIRTQLDPGAEGTPILEVLGGEPPRQVIARRPQSGEASAEVVRHAIVTSRAAVRIEVSIVSVAHDRGSDGESTAQRDVDHPVRLDVVVIAQGEIRCGVKFVLWRSGDDIHGAGDGIASVKGTLRTPQHLDSLEVEETGAQPFRSRDVDSIDVKGYCGITQIVKEIRCETPDREDDSVSEEVIVSDLEIRHLGSQILYRLHARAGQ